MRGNERVMMKARGANVRAPRLCLRRDKCRLCRLHRGGGGSHRRGGGAPELRVRSGRACGAGGRVSAAQARRECSDDAKNTPRRAHEPSGAAARRTGAAERTRRRRQPRLQRGHAAREGRGTALRRLRGTIRKLTGHQRKDASAGRARACMPRMRPRARSHHTTSHACTRLRQRRGVGGADHGCGGRGAARSGALRRLFRVRCRRAAPGGVRHTACGAGGGA
jgi:hypothetical protein